MEQTECSETSAYKTQTPGNYPKESIQRTEHGGSLKLRISWLYNTGMQKITRETYNVAVICTDTLNWHIITTVRSNSQINIKRAHFFGTLKCTIPTASFRDWGYGKKKGYINSDRSCNVRNTRAFEFIARAEPDGTRAETRFRLSPKRTSPFKSVGASIQSTAGSRRVRISLSNAG